MIIKTILKKIYHFIFRYKFLKKELNTLWDEVKRLKNPHKYYVDLSQNLWDLKNKLLENKL